MGRTTYTYREAMHAPPRSTAHHFLFTAVRIADAYPANRPPPSIDQLIEQFGMRRATAYRWRAAICAARGVASSGGHQ
jgi:hypothetical protein